MIPRESTSLGLPQTALGEQHTDYTSCLNNLAVLYQAMGKYLDAAPLLEQACAIRKKVLGSKHPRYATSLNNLAMLYQKMNDFARAEQLFQQTRGIAKDVLGDKHPNYATILGDRRKRTYRDIGLFGFWSIVDSNGGVS